MPSAFANHADGRVTRARGSDAPPHARCAHLGGALAALCLGGRASREHGVLSSTGRSVSSAREPPTSRSPTRAAACWDNRLQRRSLVYRLGRRELRLQAPDLPLYVHYALGGCV
ncbi:unnamed protein product, partial [Prorocentrum cordatum]